eukprot:1182780-Prorocentrum_minimum.AAC.1
MLLRGARGPLARDLPRGRNVRVGPCRRASWHTFWASVKYGGQVEFSGGKRSYTKGSTSAWAPLQASQSAYFLAKNISQIPYMLLAPVIYLSLYYTFTAPRATFWGTYVVLMATQFCVTGVGNLVSIVCSPATANVASVVAILIFVITSG